jgi:hypothetical protein
VPYKKDPKKMDAESFWRAATKHAIQGAPNIPEKRKLAVGFRSVYTAKKVVLNPLSHSAPQPVTRPEIQAALAAVSNLEFK